jgi:putative methyltransferase
VSDLENGGHIYIDQFRPLVPFVQKIVYSTCSIHAAENEHVVESALQSDEAKSRCFKLAPRSDVLPAWSRRGHAEEMTGTGKCPFPTRCMPINMMRTFSGDADSLVRCVPGEDGTNGFFVSCFIREQDSGIPPEHSKKRKTEPEEATLEKKKKKRKKRSSAE